jgi:hypothetical protein
MISQVPSIHPLYAIEDSNSRIDDLLHGYEKLGEALPSLQSRVALMQSGTEDMAKRLEVQLIDFSIFKSHSSLAK